MGDRYTVRAVACDHRSKDEEVFARLKAATEPLTTSWERLARAKTIAVKFNQDLIREHMFAGQRQELVSDSVGRAVLRLLKERTDAELICVDASWYRIHEENSVLRDTSQLAHVFDEFDVKLVDCTLPPLAEVQVPGGDGLFKSYQFSEEMLKADELVSVAKMKNHAFMGVTGCLKNLFGLMPGDPLARPRHYYHHLIRMPYMLNDIGRILDPALNIVDALVGQAWREWIDDPKYGRIVNTLIAGDHAVATDACMAHIMGHDPDSDWPTDPFLRENNTLRVAAAHGFGTNILDDIDFESEVEPQPAGTFMCEETDSAQTVIDWRRTMCEQALYYRDNIGSFDRYTGEYMLLQDGQVVWHDENPRLKASRRKYAGKKRNMSLYLKYVDPEEKEEERYSVYERVLGDLAGAS